MIKKILAVLFFSLVFMGIIYAALDRKFDIDKGLNNTINKILQLDGEAIQANNVYFDSKRVIKRPGSENIVTSYSPSIVKVVNYPLGVQGVMNVQNWEIHLDGASAYIRGTAPEGGTTTFTKTNTIQNPNTAAVVTAQGSTADTYDCDSLNNILYCTAYDGQDLNPIQNMKLDATMSGNLFEGFETTGDWSAYADGGTIAADTTTHVENTQGIKWNKAATSSQSGGITKSTEKLDLSAYSSWFLCIHYTAATITAGAFSRVGIFLSTAGIATDYKYYILSTSNTTGWYLINMASPDATNGSTSLANITAITVEVLMTANAGTFTTAKVDALTAFPSFLNLGVPANTNTLVAADAGSGAGLTGTYTYRFSCVDLDGTEGNVGPVSNAITLTDNAMSLSSIDVCSSTFKVYKDRNIYRIKNGGTVYYKVANVGDNITTTYTDSTTDASLGTAIAPIAADANNDNGQVGTCKYTAVYKNRLWTGPTFSNGSRLYYSDIDLVNGVQPESVPTNNFIDVNPDDRQNIRGLLATTESLYVFKENSIYEIRGDNSNNFIVTKFSSQYGTVSNESLLSVDDVNYFIDKRGVYAFGSENQFIEISSPIRDSLLDMDPLGDKARAEYFPPNNQIWFIIPAATSWSQSNVAIFNLDNGLANPTWSSYSFTEKGGCSAVSVKDLEYVRETTGRYRLHFSTAGGQVQRYAYNTSGTKDVADESCAISATWQSKYYYQEDPVSEKIYDWCYLLANKESSGDLVLAWDYDYESAFSDTATITLTGNTNQDVVFKKQFLTGATGRDKSISFRVTDNSATDSFTLLGLEVHYLPSGGER